MPATLITGIDDAPAPPPPEADGKDTPDAPEGPPPPAEEPLPPAA